MSEVLEKARSPASFCCSLAHSSGRGWSGYGLEGATTNSVPPPTIAFRPGRCDKARMSESPVFDLAQFPIHLGLGAAVLRQPAFSGMEWYEEYGARTASDGTEGRLVSMHTFSESWDSWEMHPHGEELVVCLAGRITLHQEIDGKVVHVNLDPYQAVVNPRGVWHTADVDAAATALFITAGVGTEHRARTPTA